MIGEVLNWLVFERRWPPRVPLSRRLIDRIVPRLLRGAGAVSWNGQHYGVTVRKLYPLRSSDLRSER